MKSGEGFLEDTVFSPLPALHSGMTQMLGWDYRVALQATLLPSLPASVSAHWAVGESAFKHWIRESPLQLTLVPGTGP